MFVSTNCAKSLLVIVLAVFLLCSDHVLAKSRVPISDVEVRQKKNECYADIDSWKKGKRITPGVQSISTVCTGYLLEKA